MWADTKQAILKDPWHVAHGDDVPEEIFSCLLLSQQGGVWGCPLYVLPVTGHHSLAVYSLTAHSGASIFAHI